MNERIYTLAEQAGATRWNDELNGNSIDFSPEQLDKFAELIVRECMDCATWVGKTNTSPVEPIHTAHAINQRMRQQFGVE